MDSSEQRKSKAKKGAGGFGLGFDSTRHVVGEASGKGKYREVYNDIAVLEREGKSIKYQI